MKPKTVEEITSERDALLSIVKNAQEQARRWELVVKLLVAAGHVPQSLVDAADSLAMVNTR